MDWRLTFKQKKTLGTDRSSEGILSPLVDTLRPWLCSSEPLYSGLLTQLVSHVAERPQTGDLKATNEDRQLCSCPWSYLRFRRTWSKLTWLVVQLAGHYLEQ